MIDAFAVGAASVAPFFGIVLIGWIVARAGAFDGAGLKGLNNFIFAVALPPLLFLVMADAPAAGGPAAGLLLAYGVATLSLYLAARVFARTALRLAPGEGAVFGHLSVNGNLGFLGLPLAIAVLGPEAALPTAMLLTFDIVVVMTLTTASLESVAAAERGDARPGGGLMRAARRVLTSPPLLGALGGLAWGLIGRQELGLALPGPALTLLETLGQAAAPAALFAVGATLAQNRLDRRAGDLAAASAAKLLLHPLSVALALAWISPEQPALWVAAAILAAGNPASNNAVVFANQYDRYPARASAVVLITTSLSLVTIAVIAALYGEAASGR